MAIIQFQKDSPLLVYSGVSLNEPIDWNIIDEGENIILGNPNNIDSVIVGSVYDSGSDTVLPGISQTSLLFNIIDGGLDSIL